MNRCILVVACLLLLVPVARAEDRPLVVDPSKGAAPQWVWTQQGARDKQDVAFRRTFQINGSVKQAGIWGSCDNELVVYLNGKRVMESTEWGQPVAASVGKMLVQGTNVLAIKGRNREGSAGLIVKLDLAMGDGSRQTIVTDGSWKVFDSVPGGSDWMKPAFDDAAWQPVAVIGKYGRDPWGDIGVSSGASGAQALPANKLTLLPGFKAELLYNVPKATQDSWVSMCADPKGRLIVCGQNGPLFRVTVGKTAEDTVVEPIKLPIGQAQGLLWAYDSLYVTVNGGGIGGHGSGVYRLRDTNGDDQLDQITEIVKLNNGGEHGPHGLRLGPDGKIYLIAGNFTHLPTGIEPNSPHHNYAEDQLLPRNPDGNGFAAGLMAPGSWLLRMDPDGSHRQLVCAGMRNAYDFDISPLGEFVTYDSDMEWDFGTPWYRPVRTHLLVSGGEMGWRNGTGKLPEYYADTLPPIVNMGLGSPTGVTFGTGARFPAKYQQAVFVLDWAYGNIYAVHLIPQGAGYRGTFEVFCKGRPFPVTDVVIGHDGAMYVTVGGRGTQSGLYRITYAGTESTAPAAPVDTPEAAQARAIRHKLESFHGREDQAAVPYALSYLNSPDRYLRYAARVALEWQPVAEWQDQVLADKRPTALTYGAIALSRAGDKSLQPRILKALDGVNLSPLSEDQMLEIIRAYQLCFIRMGRPDDATCQRIATRFDALYPSPSNLENRELARTLIYLKSPTVVTKTMALLASARTQEDQLYFAFVLRTLKDFWTLDQRKAWFAWVDHAEKHYTGGASFKRFLSRIQQDAMKTLNDQEKVAIEAYLKSHTTFEAVKDIAPRKFVKNWTMDELLPVVNQATHGRSFVRGREAYEAVQCAQCHRFNGDGGATGPDLTGVGGRFGPTEVLESIIQPSKVISDQYEATELITRDHDVISGRIESEDDTAVMIRTNPLAPDPVRVLKKNIVKRRISKLSTMPEGLADVLQQDEILDLIAYLRSGGNPKDPAFSK